MSLTKYLGPAEIYCNGRLLAEATSISVRTMSNNSRVRTMKKGLAGFSAGPTEVEIKIESAVPRAGYEVDFKTVCERKGAVEIIHADAGGVRRRYEGWVDDCEQSQGTDNAATLSVSFVGKPFGSTF